MSTLGYISRGLLRGSKSLLSTEAPARLTEQIWNTIPAHFLGIISTQSVDTLSKIPYVSIPCMFLPRNSPFRKYPSTFLRITTYLEGKIHWNLVTKCSIGKTTECFSVICIFFLFISSLFLLVYLTHLYKTLNLLFNLVSELASRQETQLRRRLWA